MRANEHLKVLQVGTQGIHTVFVGETVPKVVTKGRSGCQEVWIVDYTPRLELRDRAGMQIELFVHRLLAGRRLSHIPLVAGFSAKVFWQKYHH